MKKVKYIWEQIREWSGKTSKNLSGQTKQGPENSISKIRNRMTNPEDQQVFLLSENNPIFVAHLLYCEDVEVLEFSYTLYGNIK